MLQFDTLPPFAEARDSAAAEELVCAYDTLFAPTDRPLPGLRRSLFSHHELPVLHHFETPIMGHPVSGWFLVIIALSIIVTILFLRRNQIPLTALLKSAISHRTMTLTFRSCGLTHPSSFAPIAFLPLIPLTLIGCFYLHPYGLHPLRDLLQYLALLAAASAAYFTRNGIIRLIGKAFDNTEATNAYLASNYLYHLLYGIAATAFSFFICYTDNMGIVFLYILGGVIGLLFLLRFFRGMKIILTHSKSSKVYFFYYLCSLEILPILVVARLIIQ